ncbi:hypothetical protein HYFRA_00004959 [Hymenoscyphus fraxineus]|uniref:FAD/NAD(P)-binding domain-containing protein n=1 Tax=Hymenoscyphus fraxineus TaxID=746836 RepID=A0A9N9KMC5_9HELO|nr:hypothetical protein HYFRA_00004959 [Hymenoscyphus fraxineus]
MSSPTLSDVLIVGGGPAGLTAASSLARQLHTAVVFDSGEYRNVDAPYMHMVLTWDHKSPKEFRTAARKEIETNYSTIKFQQTQIKFAKRLDSGFELEDASGNVWRGKKLILAMGSADDFPDIPGYKECWGTGIFHCMFCHGYEQKNSPSSGVLALQSQANIPMAIHMAEGASSMSKKVVIYTNGNEELKSGIDTTFKSASKPSTQFSVDSRTISRLVKEKSGADVTIEFADGSKVTESFLVHSPNTHVRGPFVEQLELKLAPTGDIDAAAPFHQTSVRGIFAAGDSMTPYKVINGAFSSGCNAAVAASAQLKAEDLGHQPLF